MPNPGLIEMSPIEKKAVDAMIKHDIDALKARGETINNEQEVIRRTRIAYTGTDKEGFYNPEQKKLVEDITSLYINEQLLKQKAAPAKPTGKITPVPLHYITPPPDDPKNRLKI